MVKVPTLDTPEDRKIPTFRNIYIYISHAVYVRIYTGYTQKNGAVSKVNKKFTSHLTRAQRTPSAAATVKVSHALPAVRFSCLLRGQYPRWRRSRRKLSVCSALRFEVSRSVITVQREFRARFRKDAACMVRLF